MGLTPPSDLSADELAVWVTVCDEVDGSGSVELLRAWCASVVELRAGEAWLREHGSVLTLRDDKGNVRQVVQAPRYVQVRALRADLVRLADALRLSPRARGAVGGIAEVSATDDLRRRREARRSGAASVPEPPKRSVKRGAGGGGSRSERGADSAPVAGTRSRRRTG